MKVSVKVRPNSVFVSPTHPSGPKKRRKMLDMSGYYISTCKKLFSTKSHLTDPAAPPGRAAGQAEYHKHTQIDRSTSYKYHFSWLSEGRARTELSRGKNVYSLFLI